jgi:hypothetical protein
MSIDNRPRFGWSVLSASLQEQNANHRACGYDQTAYFDAPHFKKIAAFIPLHVGQININWASQAASTVGESSILHNSWHTKSNIQSPKVQMTGLYSGGRRGPV